MIWRNTLLSIALAASLTSPAFAETYVLRKGEPAPVDGLLLDESAAEQMDADVRAKSGLQSDAEQMQKVIDKQESALDLAEQRQQQDDMIMDKMKAALELNERAAAKMEKAADLAIQSAEKANIALDKAQEKIESANKRSFWGTAIAFVLGIVLRTFIPLP